jgi:hypothetical protein
MRLKAPRSLHRKTPILISPDSFEASWIRLNLHVFVRTCIIADSNWQKRRPTFDLQQLAMRCGSPICDSDNFPEKTFLPFTLSPQS